MLGSPTNALPPADLDRNEAQRDPEASQYLTQSWTPQSDSTFNKRTRARLTREARSSGHPPGNPCTRLIYVLKLRQNRRRTLESVWAQTQALPLN